MLLETENGQRKTYTLRKYEGKWCNKLIFAVESFWL